MVANFEPGNRSPALPFDTEVKRISNEFELERRKNDHVQQ